MSTPYELMAGPWTAYLGAANATQPLDLDTTVPVAYTKLGNSGSDDYSEDGITISEEQALEYFRGLGKTGKRKAWRTEEDVTVSLTVHDSRPEIVSYAKNGNAVTTVSAGASQSGTKTVAMYKGHEVTTHSLLLRSDAGSQYGDSYKSQFWLPVVVVASVGDFVMKKGEPIGVEFEFELLYDATNGFGKFIAQTAVKSS